MVNTSEYRYICSYHFVTNTSGLALDQWFACYIMGKIQPNSLKSKIRCFHCRASFATIQSLNRHVTSKHTKRLFDCRVCRKRFSRSDSLLRHQRLHYITPSWVDSPREDDSINGMIPDEISPSTIDLSISGDDNPMMSKLINVLYLQHELIKCLLKRVTSTPS